MSILQHPNEQITAKERQKIEQELANCVVHYLSPNKDTPTDPDY